MSLRGKPSRAVVLRAPAPVRRLFRVCYKLSLVSIAAALTLPSIAFSQSDVGDRDAAASITRPLIEALADVPARSNERRGLRGEDRDGYFAAFDFVQSADRKTLQAAAARNEQIREAMHDRTVPHLRYSLFADLLNNPQWWQGKAVRLVGHANRVVKYDPGPNDLSLDHVFESWVVTDSSLQFPTVVVTRSVPKGTEVGEANAVGVDAVGVFFQLFTYKARDGETRYAPLVIAETWTPPEAKKASRESWWLAGLAILFGLTTSITIVKASTKKRPRSRAMAGPFQAAPTTDDETDHEPDTRIDASAPEN